MASLDDIVRQTARLKPTATVVRKQNGGVNVERGELMSERARIDAIAASKQAGEARGEAMIQQPLQNICNGYVPRTYTLDEMSEAKKELDKTGVVVFQDVIDEDLQARYIDDIWSWLYRYSGHKVLRDDPKTWVNAKWPNSALPGLQTDEGVCHLPVVWEVREKAAAYFEGIYSTEDLLVSFDGMNIMRPTAGPHGSTEFITPRHWLHVDSDGSIPPDSSGYQGLVSISGMDGTNHKGGCFQAVLGSHTEDFENFFRDMWHDGNLPMSSGTSDYLLVPYGNELRTRMSRVIAPDRSLVIWKNEIFHCNSPNLSDKFRFTQYVNYYPGKKVSDDTHRERMDAFLNGVGSTHRVDVFRPSTDPCKDFIPPHLSEKQKALLGKKE